MQELQWLDLPTRGAAVQRLAFSGCGKDSTVSIETVGNPLVVIPTNGEVSLSFSAGMGTKLRALDDLNIEVEVTWPSGRSVVLERARVKWWLMMGEWADELERWRQRRRKWELSAAVSLRLGFAYQ